MEQKTELFFKVQPPCVARRLNKVREWIAEFAPEIVPKWRWNTVFYQCGGKDCLYFLISKSEEVRVGFVHGAQMKQQKLLEGGDKVMVRHFRIETNASCRLKFKKLLREAVALAQVNSDEFKKES